jgi:hypothetical protein
MKVLGYLGLILAVQFLNAQVFAFSGQDEFKVEMVKPWGEFGFRALGKGTTIAEMRFDCAKTNEMGLVVSVINNYGKTSNVVIPAEKLGSDKFKCQENLNKYFAGLYNKRTLASLKDQQKKVQFSSDFGKKKLSFL